MFKCSLTQARAENSKLTAIQEMGEGGGVPNVLSGCRDGRDIDAAATTVPKTKKKDGRTSGTRQRAEIVAGCFSGTGRCHISPR